MTWSAGAGAREETKRIISRILFELRQIDMPGPGSYSVPSSLLKQSDSFSKKGYGNGFISKNQRFLLDYETISRPSPCAYDVSVNARRPSSSLAGTAPFLATGHPGPDSVDARRAAFLPGVRSTPVLRNIHMSIAHLLLYAWFHYAPAWLVQLSSTSVQSFAQEHQRISL